MPASMYFCWSAATTSPFSACTSGNAPSAAQRWNDANISSSLTISAPLYAMKCLKVLMPRATTFSISSKCCFDQPVTHIWYE